MNRLRRIVPSEKCPRRARLSPFMRRAPACTVTRPARIPSRVALPSQRLQSVNRLTPSPQIRIPRRFYMAIPQSEDEWRAKLTPQQFRVLRQSGTEMAGTGEYNKCKDKGVYHCVGCDAPLYSSEAKFDSGCGWPAFFEGLPGALKINEDFSHGMHRIEMRCASCNGHLGHIFKGEGFKTPTNERHCVNSICLKLDKSVAPPKPQGKKAT